MNSVLLVDLSGLFWKTYHHYDQGDGDRVGQTTNVVMTMLHRYMYEYDHVGVCLDAPPYDRKKIYAEYKANRDKPSELAVAQFDRVKEEIESKGFPMFTSLGQEADDVIATLVDCIPADIDITILSSDKDLQPLTSYTNVIWSSPLTGEIFDHVGIEEKYGCKPKDFTLALALVGGHDNIPGIRGIGQKIGCKIAKEFHDLESVILALDNDPASVPKGNLIAEQMAGAELSWALVKLNKRCADIDVDRLFEPIKQPVMEVEKEVEAEVAEITEEKEVEQKSTGIVKRTPVEIVGRNYDNSLEATDLDQAKLISRYLFESGLFQKFRNQQSIFAAMMLGRDLGLPGVVTALNSIHLVKSAPYISAATMVALVMRSKQADFLKMVESSSESCIVKTHRVGDPDPDPIVITFTIDDAHKMGLTSRDQWIKQPAVMLQWRAMTRICRLVYPDIINGLYAIEEFE